MAKQIHELPAASSVEDTALVPLQRLNPASPSGWSTVAATLAQVSQQVAHSQALTAALQAVQGISADAGNVLLAGADGKPLLTDAVVKAHQTITTQSWDAVGKVLTLTNEAGTTLTVNLAAVDAHLQSATLAAGILVLHGTDDEPDVTVDLTTFLQAVSTHSDSSIILAGAGTPASPLQASLQMDPSASNLLSLGPNGLLAKAVNADWNATSGPAQILNKPSLNPNCPVLVVEFGHSAQANNGRGIDRGGWYQVDLGVGVTSINGFQFTANSDGSANIPGGVYLVCAGAKIIADSTDTYALPAQMTVATGQAYGYPGIYQYAVQRFPDLPVSNANTAGVLGYAAFSGVATWSGASPLWLGFSKVLGSASQTPLRLQGYLSYVKIG